MPLILVFRPGALGDTILTMDALIALRAGFPDHLLELVGNPQAGAVLRAAGLVDSVTSFDSAEITRLYLPTPVVLPRWATASVAVVWLTDPDPISLALQGAGVGRVVIAGPPGAESQQHAADYLLGSLAPLGLAQLVPVPLLRLPGRSRETRVPARSAIVHPGSGSARKNWPPDRFAGIIERLREAGWEVSLLSGPADAAPVRGVIDQIAGTPPEIIEPPSILGLASRLAEADLYIGNDSGPTHLSARVGAPTLAIFGPTDPMLWAPRGPLVSVLTGDPWPEVDQVWETALGLMNGAAPSN